MKKDKRAKYLFGKFASSNSNLNSVQFLKFTSVQFYLSSNYFLILVQFSAGYLKGLFFGWKISFGEVRV